MKSDSSEMKSYSFRAECIADIGRFLDAMGDIEERVELKIGKDSSFPDIDVVMESGLELGKLRKVMRNIVDGHVMLETLNFTDKYTGKRYYEE